MPSLWELISNDMGINELGSDLLAVNRGLDPYLEQIYNEATTLPEYTDGMSVAAELLKKIENPAGMNDLQMLGMTGLPIASDVAGLLGDAQWMLESPDERTWTNAGLAGLGALPFVPAGLGTIKKAAKAPQDEGTLSVIHNMSAENLAHADKLGGLPVPSMAVTKGDDPMSFFGDITLIGDKEMATPSARNPYFSSDAYSPRYPTSSIDTVFDDDALRVFNQSILDSSSNLDATYYNLEDNFSDLKGMKNDPYILNKFLKDKGIDVEPIRHSDGKTNPYGTRDKLQGVINADEGLKKGFNDWSKDAYEGLSPSGRLFQGFTSAGNRRYKPETIDNITKVMKGNVNAGEGMNYGIGSYRAAITPRFKNIKEMKGKEDMLVDVIEMASVKNEMDRKYNILLDKLAPYKTDKFGATIDDFMVDLALGNDSISEILPNLPDDVLAEWRAFDNELRNAPTSYFEGKPQRAVDIGEFKGALVPSDAPQSVFDILDKKGVSRVERYTDETDRVSKMQSFKDLMFTAAPVGLLTDYKYGEKDEEDEEYINMLKLQGLLD